jgi:rfaE bifunctional protein kinase chain/domain
MAKLLTGPVRSAASRLGRARTRDPEDALIERVTAFSKVRVLVVGDLVADHYVYGQTERVSREAPVLIVRHEREEVKLGGAANAAANAASLGGQVTALGALGSDEMGARMRQLFTAANIALAPTAKFEIATETKTRILAGGLSTTRQQMLRIDRGSQGQLPEPARKALARAVGLALKQCDVAVVSDYGAGVVCDETREVLRAWARRGGQVCADSRYALRSLLGARACKPNEPELAALTGLPIGSDKELKAAATRAMQLLDCQTLLVTRGRRGMAVFERGLAPTFFPVHGVAEAVDVTGAGDTVIATFALALGAGASSAEAAQIANVSGGLVVQKPGTATVSPEELIAQLRS